jgi:hypothetical protein
MGGENVGPVKVDGSVGFIVTKSKRFHRFVLEFLDFHENLIIGVFRLNTSSMTMSM